MKIYGPYKRKDGRKHIIKIYPNGKRRTQSYPRYLMEQHLGRELLESEEVDHIDNDHTNNDISNLQLLTKKENLQKAAELRLPEIDTFFCPTCDQQFEKAVCIVRGNQAKQNKAGPFCSRSCAGQYSTSVQYA